VYNDGPARVEFGAVIDPEQYPTDPICEFPAPEEWYATGPYTPREQGDSGDFWLGLFDKDHSNFPDDERCAACPDACWRLWLEDGVYDGYENWACEPERGKIEIIQDPPSEL